MVDEQTNLENLYATVTTASGNLDDFLRANENNIIQVSAASLPTLDVLARYSPEYPCFLKQMADLAPTVDKAFGKGTDQPGLHAHAGDHREPRPVRGRPGHAEVRGQQGAALLRPAARRPTRSRSTRRTARPRTARRTRPRRARSNTGILPAEGAQSTSTQSTGTSAAGADDTGLPNSAAEEGFLAELIGAETLGRRRRHFPSWASELIGPLFRGAEVTIK